MPKTVKVSISAIVKDVDKALQQLSKGQGFAASPRERSAISAKIKKLQSVKKALVATCKGKSMTVTVPSK